MRWPLVGLGVEVTITQRYPIEQVDADARPSAVAMAAWYELVRQEAQNLVVADGKGRGGFWWRWRGRIMWRRFRRIRQIHWGRCAAKLKADDAALGQVEGPDDDRSNGHMRLIIGYNAATEELAISDSWGLAFAERWMYVGTAVKISQGRLGYLSW